MGNTTETLLVSSNMQGGFAEIYSNYEKREFQQRHNGGF
jgi:hypothetical protein